MGVEIPQKPAFPSNYPPQIPDPILNNAFLADIKSDFDESQISTDPAQRLRHGHGHSQGEMYAIKYSALPRIPDAIIYPSTHAQVLVLAQAASKHNVSLVPFGGGTNVSEALECSPSETRMIISVDTKQLNKILWIDRVNRMACIQAGIVGRHLTAALAKEGYTLGHEPDSIEFSTLGGWIATNASGMKKNKYGNIEDLVLDVTVVTAKGVLQHNAALPRESIGSDERKLVFGSEGSLGIITEAVVKIFPLAEVTRYGSVLFPSFETGVEFMYALAQARAQPASVRLVDNTQFQLSMALKPASVSTLAALVSRVQKFYVTSIRGFDAQVMVACTLVFEGSASEVARQEDLVYAMASRRGGLKAGAENGERGYLLTYNIAYIRDFGLSHYVLAESFETSVPWSGVLSLCSSVKMRILAEHEARGLPGKPFVTCRVTQVYDTGAAVYFYYAYFFEGVSEPSCVYREIELAAREEILKCGGALSHHHGVGKLRSGLLNEVMSEQAMKWRQVIKASVDPRNVFGTGAC
jgi:alkyldihydroxyacetonephosphate synthase